MAGTRIPDAIKNLPHPKPMPDWMKSVKVLRPLGPTPYIGDVNDQMPTHKFRLHWHDAIKIDGFHFDPSSLTDNWIAFAQHVERTPNLEPIGYPPKDPGQVPPNIVASINPEDASARLLRGTVPAIDYGLYDLYVVTPTGGCSNPVTVLIELDLE